MPWFMPGDNIMSATMPIDRLLIHRPALAVYAGECRVYPYGFVFSVTVVRRWPDEAPRIPAAPLNPFGMLGPLHETGHEKSQQVLSFGVRFPNGRSSIAQGHVTFPSSEPPTAPVIRAHHGEGSDDEWSQAFYVWGLPSEGSVSVFYSWGLEKVPESRFEIDGDDLRAAAARAVVLWEDGPDEGNGDSVTARR